MAANRTIGTIVTLCAVLILSGCGDRMSNLFGGDRSADRAVAQNEGLREREEATGSSESVWDLFSGRQDPGAVMSVNRYIWTASLEVLDFLPIETVDPFSGVITTGFGTPPGGGRPYRATIAVTDAALDARSLNVALVSRSGPASAETVRAVENAILTRARQIRIRELGL